MKKLLSVVLAMGMTAFAQDSGKGDMKQAGKDVKKAGKDTGKAAKPLPKGSKTVPRRREQSRRRHRKTRQESEGTRPRTILSLRFRFRSPPPWCLRA